MRVATLLLAVMPLISWAHGGGLDANGCHHNHKTGDYHCHRAQAPRRETPPRSAASGQCGVKSYCKDMVSCEEAMFHLRECGLSRLDGDGDGIPCESLCGSR